MWRTENLAGGSFRAYSGLEEQEHVLQVLDAVRLRNAVAVAWIRIVACGLLFAVFLSGSIRALESTAQAPGLAAVISAADLVIGLGVLWGILRRPSRSLILLAAAMDLAAVSAAALLAFFPGAYATQNVILYAATLQLLLLLDSLTVGRYATGALAVVSWLLLAVLAAYRQIKTLDALVALAILAVFGATIAFAKSWYSSIAAHSASQEWTASMCDRHARELEVANAALRASQAEARELSSLIVHDLRNPLATIWANLEAVRQSLPPSDPDDREAIEASIAEVRRANGLIGDLLVVTRLENDSQHDPAIVYVDQLLAEVERAYGPLVRKTGARVEWRRADHAPPKLKADPALLRRMLDNLVGNAARYVQLGDRVEVAAEADGDRLRLAVRNSGPPVPTEVRQHLFQKHASTGRRGGCNVGLGLYMCRLVAERHGGSIALVERQGWNVSFEVTLPAG